MDDAGHRDRSGLLLGLGIAEIALGGLAALATLLALLGALLAGSVARTGAPPPSLRMMLPTVGIYGAAAAFFVWVGLGTLRARRWARTLMHVLSWLWLATGVLSLAMWLLMPSNAFEAGMPEGQRLPPGMVTMMRAFVGGIMAIFFVALPALFAWAYGSRSVRATFERRDPTVPWTDRCPEPVLALALLLGLGAGSLVVSGTMVPVLPVFGRLVGGVAATPAMLGIAVGFGLLARAVYRMRPWSAWAALAATAVGGASAVVTYARIPLADVYREMGMPEAQVALARRVQPFGEHGMAIWMAVMMAPFLGFTLWVAVRHFSPRRAAE